MLLLLGTRAFSTKMRKMNPRTAVWPRPEQDQLAFVGNTEFQVSSVTSDRQYLHLMAPWLRAMRSRRRYCRVPTDVPQ